MTTELSFTDKGTKWVSDVFVSVNGEGLHVTQEKKGYIQLYAYADDLKPRLVCSVNSDNEVLQLGLPTGLNVVVYTRFKPKASLVIKDA